jgi:hypothetical protein
MIDERPRLRLRFYPRRLVGVDRQSYLMFVDD